MATSRGYMTNGQKADIPGSELQGNPFYGGAVSTILRNPVYTGRIRDSNAKSGNTPEFPTLCAHYE